MSGEHWWRAYHGAPVHPKWRAVAEMAKVSVGVVVSVVWVLLDRASQAAERGRVWASEALSVPVRSLASHSEGNAKNVPDRVLRSREIAAALGWPIQHVNAILDALSEISFIDDGRITSWEKRQPKREDNSTDRTRRHREAKRERNGTQRNAEERIETHGNARGEERLLKKKKKNMEKENGHDTDRASKLKDDWEPTLRTIDLVKPLGITGDRLEAELAKFKNHHIGKGTRWVDWDRAFQNWARKAIEYQPPAPPKPSRPTHL